MDCAGFSVQICGRFVAKSGDLNIECYIDLEQVVSKNSNGDVVCQQSQKNDDNKKELRKIALTTGFCFTKDELELANDLQIIP